MKKLFVLVAVASLSFATSCKQETSKTTETNVANDSIEVVKETTTTTTTLSETEAKAKLDEAKKALDEAKAKGDKVATEAAQKAYDDANTAWTSAKAAVNNAAQDVKEGVNNAAEKVDEKATTLFLEKLELNICGTCTVNYEKIFLVTSEQPEIKQETH